MIHVVLIATGKVTIDAIPGVTQNVSWTAVNLSYLAVRARPMLNPHDVPSLLTWLPSQCSYLMFHWVTGIPFGSELHGGAYDDLTLWEQIDGGAQNTPSKKWLFSVPVVLYVFHPVPSLLVPSKARALTRLTKPISFLLSTHYTNYNPWLFAINLSALIFALVPKLPIVRSTAFWLSPLRLINIPGISQAHRQRLRILTHDRSGNATPSSSPSGTSTPPDLFHAPSDLYLTDAQFR
jgi:hypothetical protein